MEVVEYGAGDLKRRTLDDEMKRAGFIDIRQPDVDAKSDMLFMVASKPE